jgi:HK97 gp10 family phage protein
MIRFRVSGLEGLEAALRELKTATAKRTVRKVLGDALEPVADTARLLAPFDDGDLRESIVVGTKLTGAAREEARWESPSRVSVYVGTANRNAVPLEFGSSRTLAQPFMRPAWDMNRARVLAHILENMRAEVAKAAARALRKSGRGR